MEEGVRWYLTPSEALYMIRSDLGIPQHPLPQKPFIICGCQMAAEKKEKEKIDVEEEGTSEEKEVDPHFSVICVNCFHTHGVSKERAYECDECDCINYLPKDKTAKKELISLEGKIRKKIVKAMQDYSMIKGGDKVMVALSGGKDSLALLNLLIAINRKRKDKFEIGACTVDPDHPEYDPSRLKKYLKHLGIPYFYKEQSIMKAAETCMDRSICSFCSRMKRGVLYTTCREQGYNVLAMGQHLDDLCESFLMSLFFNGKLRTMKAAYDVNEGDIRVVRPMVYVREYMLRTYSRIKKLPVVSESCPACFEAPKQRARVKLVLAKEERESPSIYSCLLRSMKPIMGLPNTNQAGLTEDELISRIVLTQNVGIKRKKNVKDLPSEKSDKKKK